MGVAMQKPTKRTWLVPRDRKEFVGCLVGGYKDTREKMKREFLIRYGIRVVTHFGLEKRTDSELYVQLGTEICIILTDDVDKMLPKVLKACLKANVPTIGISRKPHTWDTIFETAGFANPPRFRDGFDVDLMDPANKIDLGQMEAELKAIDDKPRLAYEDPAAKAGKLGTVMGDALAKALEPPKVDVVQRTVDLVVDLPDRRKSNKGTAKPGTTVPASEGFGQALRSAREAKGWTQGRLAKELARAQGNVSAWERGAAVPLYEPWMELKALFPDLPEPPDILGKDTYDLRHKDDKHAAILMANKVPPKPLKLPPIEMPPGPGKTLTALHQDAPEPVQVPSITVRAHEQPTLPYTPVVHMQAPQKPLAPVVRAATPHVTSQRLHASPLDEYMAVLQELKAFDESIKPRREEILARVDAIHKLVTGR